MVGNQDQASKRGLLCLKEAPGGSETYTTTNNIGIEKLSKNLNALIPQKLCAISVFVKGAESAPPSLLGLRKGPPRN